MKNLNLIYYSPTSTTQKIVREIGQNLGIKNTSENNITRGKIESEYEINSNDLTIIGMPVYGGRLPLTVIQSLKNIKAKQSPAVIVVVYGNRDYDDALLELKEMAEECGFNIIAGATFIGEHSFSTDGKPIARARPDLQDLEKCKNFAREIATIISSPGHDDYQNTLFIPGSTPYKKRNPLPTYIHPETNSNQCALCGHCAEVCPTNAISVNKSVETNGELCTWCCACVKICPANARIFENPKVDAIRDKLFNNCSVRKEPEFFLFFA